MSVATSGLLVVGSLHHDLMLDAPHLPRLGETVTGHRWYPKFGGKGGNQAVAAARAGLRVRMLGAVGCDAFAATLLDALAQADIDTRWVAELPDSPTGMSVAISDAQGDYGAVIVSGANLDIDPAQVRDDALWLDIDMVLLQNEVRTELNAAVALEARRRGIRVCLNAAPARPLPAELREAVDILIVNAIEAEALCGHSVDTVADGERAARALGDLHPVVIVTLGGNGVIATAGGNGPWHEPAVPVQVRSTHGAGDTFTGALCAALLSDAAVDAAVGIANAAAARHVAGPASS